MQTGNTVRLMTFNLLFGSANNPAGSWEERRPLVRQLLRDCEPDILCFQEVMQHQLEALQQDLPGYGEVHTQRSGQSKMPLWMVTLTPGMLAGGLALLRGAGDNRVRKLFGGALLAGAALPVAGTLGGLAVNQWALLKGAFSPIFYRKDRLRLLDCERVRLSERPNDPLTLMLGTWLPRYAVDARFELLGEGGELSVCNVHLDYMPLVTKGSLEKLRTHLDESWNGSPQFVLGDFNADLDEEECAYLTRETPGDGVPGFQSAWCEAREQHGPEHTVHSGMGEDSPKKKRADHVMLRPGMTVSRCVTLTHHSGGTYPSDHYPVMVDVELDPVASQRQARPELAGARS